ncbi:unnamed protein product, partial [Closterium sp. NIES-53]
DLSHNFLTGPPLEILNQMPGFKADLSSNYLSGPWNARNCSQYSIAANCFAQDRACVKETQRPPAQCTAFCGVSAKSSTSACDGRGICRPVGPSLVPTCSCYSESVQFERIRCIATGLIEQGYTILPRFTELTNGLHQQTVGRFMANPVTLFAYPPGVTSGCGLELAFRVNFTFAIFPQNGDARSNGFAFVIAAKAKVGKPNGVGYGGMGPGNIAVVFKTLQTNKQCDSEHHVGLNINGAEKSMVKEVSPFTLTNRAGYTAWVDYEPGNPGTIQVFLADSAMKPEKPLLQTSLSLCELLRASVKPFQPSFSFGFVASTTVKPFQRYNILFSYVQTGAPSSKLPENNTQALGLSLSKATFAPSQVSPFSRYVSADFKLSTKLMESWSINDPHSWDNVPWLAWPVKNQNDCNACWAYAVVASVEAAYGIANNSRAPQLSEESLFAAMGLTDADKCTAGGSPAQAFENLVALNANNGSGLTANNSATRYPVQAFERAQFKGYVGLMLAVRHQPVLVHIQASAATFNAYNGTFKYQDPDCYTGSLNHVVLVIGYSIVVEDGNQKRIAPPFWIIRNSWGEGWGENGHMRMDIQGGDGVCGINVLPGIYPIIRIPGDPCGRKSYKFDKETETSMNPCGRFQCQTSKTRSNSNNCNCSIPALGANPQPFVEVKNGYGSNTCAYVNVCGSYFKNPCYVGACINDGKGAYSCICPPNHVPSKTVDGFPTCDPANSTATTMTVQGDNWLCSDVYALVGLSLDEFTRQNAGIDCSQPLPKGSILQLDGTPATPCTAFFYTLKGDTCESISSQLNYSEGNLTTLNPGLNCSEPLKAGRSACLERSAAFAYMVPDCKKYGTLTREDKCDQLLQETPDSEESSKESPWLALYRSNPGLTCSSTIPQSASAAGSKIGVQICLQAEYWPLATMAIDQFNNYNVSVFNNQCKPDVVGLLLVIA